MRSPHASEQRPLHHRQGPPHPRPQVQPYPELLHHPHALPMAKLPVGRQLHHSEQHQRQVLHLPPSLPWVQPKSSCGRTGSAATGMHITDKCCLQPYFSACQLLACGQKQEAPRGYCKHLMLHRVASIRCCTNGSKLSMGTLLHRQTSEWMWMVQSSRCWANWFRYCRISSPKVYCIKACHSIVQIAQTYEAQRCCDNAVTHLYAWEDNKQLHCKVWQLEHHGRALRTPLLLPIVQPVCVVHEGICPIGH